MLKIGTVITVFLLLITSFCFGQEVEQDSLKPVLTQELEEVILTATRTKRQLGSLPLPVQIVRKRDIEQSNSVRLADLLNEQTGLITVVDFGGSEGIQLQGLDSQYTMILVNGAPLIGRSAGTLDLNRISVGNIKKIEVVRGASSSLYGSEALGGVINIITEEPKTGFSGDLNHRSGTFNTNDTGLNLNYKKGKFGVTAFVNRFENGGYDLNDEDDFNTVDPFENYTVTTGLSYEVNDQTKISLNGRYFTQNQGLTSTEERAGEADIDEWNAQLLAKHEFSSKWETEFEFYSTNYRAGSFLEDPDGSVFDSSDFDQLLVRPEFRAVYKLNSKSTFNAGIGMNHETLERDDFSENPVFNAPYVFLQYDSNLTEKLNLILGARFDAHNEYESQFSPKLAGRYKVNEFLSFKGSAGYGFKAPDFRQLYFNFSTSSIGYIVLGYNAVQTELPELIDQGLIVNQIVPLSEFSSDLSPENSLGINFGADYRLKNGMRFSMNLFRNSIDDLIDIRIIANLVNGQNVFSYYNVNSVVTQGVEFEANWSPFNALRISGGYQLLYAYDTDAVDAFENGEVFARETPTSPAFRLDRSDYFGLFNRSRHMANLKLFYTIDKWNANTNLRATYRSKYGLFDSNSNGYLDKYDDFVDGFAVLDLAFNKTFYDNYEVGVGVDNLLDFTDEANIPNLPGRIIYGTLNIKF